MTINLEELESEAAYGKRISELEGGYRQKLSGSFMNVIININPLTKWLYKIRQTQTSILATNADKIATAINMMERCIDSIASENATEMALTEAVHAYVSGQIMVRQIPDLGDNYRHVLSVFCYAADYAFRNEDGESPRALNLTIEDLDACASKLAEIEQSHASATRMSPPQIIELMPSI
jgi:hypothetical protein